DEKPVKMSNKNLVYKIRYKVRYLGSENVFIPPSLVDYCDIFPRTLDERVVWYQNGDIDEIITANMVGARLRYQNIKDCGKDFILFDRGYLTLHASSISRYMSRKCLSFEVARKKVFEISEEVNYDRNEDLSVLLKFGDDFIDVVEKREKSKLDSGFKSYIKNFDFALGKLIEDYDNTFVVDASLDIGVIQDKICSKIKI
ncbi:MAG: hypothetical protein L6408_02885, partial [Nanoarchaeota archaeon]|nr:hypothetical protein [Nanoarchaeota archaeon]